MKNFKSISEYVGIHYAILSTFAYVGIFYNSRCVSLSVQWLLEISKCLRRANTLKLPCLLSLFSSPSSNIYLMIQFYQVTCYSWNGFFQNIFFSSWTITINPFIPNLNAINPKEPSLTHSDKVISIDDFHRILYKPLL